MKEKDIKVPVPKPLPPPGNVRPQQQKQPVSTGSEVDRLMALFNTL